MKLTIGIDPGKSGGYAIAWGKGQIDLHNLGEDFEFVEHIQDLKDHPDVTSIEAVVELVPPFAGRNIPSSVGFKLGKSLRLPRGLPPCFGHTVYLSAPPRVAERTWWTQRIVGR